MMQRKAITNFGNGNFDRITTHLLTGTENSFSSDIIRGMFERLECGFNFSDAVTDTLIQQSNIISTLESRIKELAALDNKGSNNEVRT